MPNIHPNALSTLPLFAQALVAARAARRAVLAMLHGPDQATALAACDAIESITHRGSGYSTDHPEFRRLAHIRPSRSNEPALDAIRWALDSAGAAQSAGDFPVDAVVTASARRCFVALERDRRVKPLQLSILIASDADLLAFACSEIHVGAYDPLPDHVFSRLTPCHALTLDEPRPTPEELVR